MFNSRLRLAYRVLIAFHLLICDVAAQIVSVLSRAHTADEVSGTSGDSVSNGLRSAIPHDYLLIICGFVQLSDVLTAAGGTA